MWQQIVIFIHCITLPYKLIPLYSTIRDGVILFVYSISIDRAACLCLLPLACGVNFCDAQTN